MRQRMNRVSVRYSDDEYKQLQERIKESGQTTQSYMLNCSLGARLTTEVDHSLLIQEARVLVDMDRQLRGIGTNLNQLSHNANTYGYSHDEAKINELICLVVHIRDEVHGRWQSIRQSIAHRSL